MKRNVLFIDCCIRRELSRTRALADAMLGALRKREDLAITELCLMDEPLTYFSEGFFAQRERLLAQGEREHPALSLCAPVCIGGCNRDCSAFLGFGLPGAAQGIY